MNVAIEEEESLKMQKGRMFIQCVALRRRSSRRRGIAILELEKEAAASARARIGTKRRSFIFIPGGRKP